MPENYNVKQIFKIYVGIESTQSLDSPGLAWKTHFTIEELVIHKKFEEEGATAEVGKFLPIDEVDVSYSGPYNKT